RNCGPVFEYEFDNASVVFSEATGSEIVAHFRDGRVKPYGRPSTSSDAAKLWSFVAGTRAGTPVVCGIEAATPQTRVVCAADASMPEPVAFPRRLVEVRGEKGVRKTSVVGLDEALGRSYETWQLPHELGVGWAVAG